MNIDYPETRRDDVVDDYHGVKVEDPYRWLEDTSDPEVQKWIDQQNMLAESILTSYPGRDSISKRTSELLEHESISSLTIRETPDGIRYFYKFKRPNVSQSILCYQNGEKGERIELINPITLKSDGTVSIDWFFPSWNGRYIAYGISESGTEDSVLHVYDLSINDELSDVIPRTSWAWLGWNQKNTGFYYTRYPLPGTVSDKEMHYFRHVYYHQLGTDYGDDPKIFGEGRNSTEMSLVLTNPENDWVLLIAWRYTSADIYITKGTRNSELIPLFESDSDISFAHLTKDSVFLATYENAQNGRIIRFPLDETKESHVPLKGTEFIEEGDYAIGELIASTDRHLIYSILKNASNELCIHDLKTGSLIEKLEFPTPITITNIITCPTTKKLYFTVSSYINPDSIQTYEVGGVLKSFFTPNSNLDSSRFKVEQVWYKSKDGTNVSMFLIADKKTNRSEMTPILIRGYGNGGFSYTPMFFPEYMIWLENGGILAIPSIRGGGEYGEEWHKKGSRSYKQNTFDDFIAATEWLHENGYGNPTTTAMMGRSAGGLLVGAVTTQRPELFASVYCAVPILDMLRFKEHTVAKIWLSEFGDPDIEEEFGWLYQYSPYHNVSEGIKYPAVLFYTALGDIRADPSHAMKMAVRVQNATTAEITHHPILLSVDRKVGHSAFGVGLPTEKLVEIRTNQVIFHAKHTGLDLN